MKIARRNIYNLRYTDDTTLMAESEDELKSLLVKVKEDIEKVGLKLKKQRYLVPSLHGKQMGKQWKQFQTIFGGSKITADGDCSHEIKRGLLLGRKVMTSLRQHIEKQRHYFANKGPSKRGYGFSSLSCMDVKVGL